MTVQEWLAAATADARRRGLAELVPLLESLGRATDAIRNADWNDDPREGAVAEDPAPVEPAGRPRQEGARLAPEDEGPEPARRAGRSADLPLVDLAGQIQAGRLKSVDLTEDCLRNIEARRDLNAFVSVLADSALEQARHVDAEVAAGRYKGPLHGIPISLKDLIDVAGVPTTAASRLRAGHRAAHDAPIVAKLRDAGAVIVGKTNLHEFAYGTTSDDSAFGPVGLPHDPSRSAGGSSGGSAVSVVTGMAVASIGTDTGGSIRIPAALCGAVGLKPTFGEIPCEGIVPLCRSLDHAGPITRTVADAARLYAALAGRRADSSAAPPATLRLGVPEGYLLDLLDDDVRGRFEQAVDRMRSAGALVQTVRIPHGGLTAAVYLHIALPQASAYHRRSLDASPDMYTAPVRLRLHLGRYVLAEDMVRARTGRRILRREVDRALDGCDALILPTVPIEAPTRGATTMQIRGRPESVRNLMLRLTQLFNLTRHPAISLPCGTTGRGLPCGLQLVGARHQTADLLRVALACEHVLAADTPARAAR